MTDYMLRFADEAEATAILYTSTEDDEGQVTLTPNYYAIDTLGTLYERPPEPVAETLETLSAPVTEMPTEPVTETLETLSEPVTEMLSEPAIAPITEQYTPTPLPGWHVNVRHIDEAPELDVYKVDPSPTTPRRVWA